MEFVCKSSFLVKNRQDSWLIFAQRSTKNLMTRLAAVHKRLNMCIALLFIFLEKALSQERRTGTLYCHESECFEKLGLITNRTNAYYVRSTSREVSVASCGAVSRCALREASLLHRQVRETMFFRRFVRPGVTILYCKVLYWHGMLLSP